jgi:ketosteroid isomerase-like protein
MPENSAIVRRGYEAFNTGDLKALTELFGDNVSWHTPGRSPLAGDIVGREAVFARLGRYLAETGGTFRAELKRLLTDEDGRVIGSTTTLPSATASTWTSTAASSSSSRAAGSWTAASTSTTFVPGTSSGRRPHTFHSRRTP